MTCRHALFAVCLALAALTIEVNSAPAQAPAEPDANAPAVTNDGWPQYPLPAPTAVS